VGNFLRSWEPVSFRRKTLLHGVRKQIGKSSVSTGLSPLVLLAFQGLKVKGHSNEHLNPLNA
jgi:hypothetical protein